MKDRTMQSTTICKDTRAWKLQVWVSFGLAVLLCGSGLAYLPGADLDRAFMVMGYMFCLSTAFALAKFVRDNELRKTDTPMWGTVVWKSALTGMWPRLFGVMPRASNGAEKSCHASSDERGWKRTSRIRPKDEAR